VNIVQINKPGSYLLVLPVLNELKNLEILLPRIWSIYPSIEILVVDDNSQDGTQEYLESVITSGRLLFYIRRPRKLGIGSAHLAGLEYAISKNYEYVITMDADLTHRPEDLRKFVGAKVHSDLIIGSRYLDDSNMSGWSISRKVLTKFGHFVTLIAFLEKWDMSSGMRMYKTEKIPFRILASNCPNDYAYFFTSAITYRKLLMSVEQVPIQLDQRFAGKSKMTFSLMFVGIKLLALYALRLKRIQI
jgi:dolichol-phosphate mannosyltransferase